jgi:tRNA (Thr-GGU) A37 N-methylase
MLKLTPIGTVRNEIRTPIVQSWGKVVSDLLLDERYTEGLDGIEDFFHVLNNG